MPDEYEGWWLAERAVYGGLSREMPQWHDEGAGLDGEVDDWPEGRNQVEVQGNEGESSHHKEPSGMGVGQTHEVEGWTVVRAKDGRGRQLQPPARGNGGTVEVHPPVWGNGTQEAAWDGVHVHPPARGEVTQDIVEEAAGVHPPARGSDVHPLARGKGDSRRGADVHPPAWGHGSTKGPKDAESQDPPLSQGRGKAGWQGRYQEWWSAEE